MSSNDSSRGRESRGDDPRTPISFYVMMGAMALAFVFFIIALLSM